MLCALTLQPCLCVGQGKVAAAISGKDVGILINNVGVSYPFPKYFNELTDDEVRRNMPRVSLRIPPHCYALISCTLYTQQTPLQGARGGGVERLGGAEEGTGGGGRGP